MSPRRPIGRRTNGGRRVFWSWVLVAAATSALVCVHVWTRVTVLEKSYRLGQAREEGAKLSAELAFLKTEVATLRNVRRLDLEARTKLRMGPAQKVVVLKGTPDAGVQATAQARGNGPQRGGKGAAQVTVASALAN